MGSMLSFENRERLLVGDRIDLPSRVCQRPDASDRAVDQTLPHKILSCKLHLIVESKSARVQNLLLFGFGDLFNLCNELDDLRRSSGSSKLLERLYDWVKILNEFGALPLSSVGGHRR